MAKPKILVIYTGGTFGMDEHLEIPKLSANALKKRLLSQVPEMKKIAEGEVHVLFNTDSCQMGATHWFTLAHHIHAQAKKFAGVVILHGTDTLAYTAAALSYLLSPSPIPIVITGAQKPLSTLRNDARTNLLTALEIAANAPETLKNRVMVTFHDEVFLGSRVRKVSALNFSAFESPRFPRLAKVGSTIQYESVIHHLPKIKQKNPLLESIQFDPLKLPRFLKTEVTPEFPSALFTPELFRKLDGILLTLYTSGTAPTENQEFIQFMKYAKESKTPLFAITEREDAPLNLSAYASGKTLQNQGVLWCRDLTPEAAWVKAILLHLRFGKAALPRHWEKNLSDETLSTSHGHR